jgi:hypothetical protein
MIDVYLGKEDLLASSNSNSASYNQKRKHKCLGCVSLVALSLNWESHVKVVDYIRT